MYEKEIKELGKYKFTVHDLKQSKNSIVSSILFLVDSKYENQADYIQDFYPGLLDFLKKKDDNINQGIILKRIDDITRDETKQNNHIKDTVTESYACMIDHKISLVPKIILENFKFNSNLYTYGGFYDYLASYYMYIKYNLIIKDYVEKLKSEGTKGDQELYQETLETIKMRDTIKNKVLFFYNLIQEKNKKYVDYPIYIDFITDMLKINIILVDDTLKTKDVFFTKNKNSDDKFVILTLKNNIYSPVTNKEKKVFSVLEDKEIYRLFVVPDTSIDEILEKEKNQLPSKKSIKNIVDELEISED